MATIKSKRTNRPRARKNIPLDEDIAVFCRVWLRYIESEDQNDLALVVLAQRVVTEKIRAYYRGNAAAAVYDLLEKLKKNKEAAADYDRRFIGKWSLPTLAKALPAYEQAGLVG